MTKQLEESDRKIKIKTMPKFWKLLLNIEKEAHESREQMIRFLIDDCELTYEEIGQALELSKQRVYQIINNIDSNSDKKKKQKAKAEANAESQDNEQVTEAENVSDISQN